MSQEKKQFTFGSGLKNSVWNNQNKQQPSPQSLAPPKSSNPFLKSTINKTNMSDEKTSIQFNGINDEKVPHKFGGGLGKSVWGDQNNPQSATPNAEPQKQSNMFTTSNSNKTDMNEKKNPFTFGSGLKNSPWSTQNNQETAPPNSEPPQPIKSVFLTNNKTIDNEEKKTFTFGEGLKNSTWGTKNNQETAPTNNEPPQQTKSSYSTNNKTIDNEEKKIFTFGSGLKNSPWSTQNNQETAPTNSEPPQPIKSVFLTNNKTIDNEEKKTFAFGEGLKNSTWGTKNNQETAPPNSVPTQPNKSLFSTNNKTSPISSQIDDKKKSFLASGEGFGSIAGNIKQEPNNPFLKSESSNKTSSTFGKPKYNVIPPPSDQHFTTESSLKQEPSNDLQSTEKSIKKEEKIQAKESPKPTEKFDLQFKDKVENPPSTFDSKPKHLPWGTQQNTSLPKPYSEASLNSNSSPTENQPANEANEFNEKCSMKVKTHGLPIPFVIKFYEMICRVNPDYEWNDIDKDLEELATTVVH